MNSVFNDNNTTTLSNATIRWLVIGCSMIYISCAVRLDRVRNENIIINKRIEKYLTHKNEPVQEQSREQSREQEQEQEKEKEQEQPQVRGETSEPYNKNTVSSELKPDTNTHFNCFGYSYLMNQSKTRKPVEQGDEQRDTEKTLCKLIMDYTRLQHS